MKILASDSLLIIIQARINSQRLPGKVLYEIKGKSALQHLIESLLNCCSRNQIVVATSLLDLDNPIVEFCSRHYVKCFRGPLENVAERFLEVIKFYKPEVFVRISADSPLFDYRILEHGFSLWKEELDLLTTVGSGQPSGMNAEFVKSNTFCSTYNQFTVSNHFEHVTPYFYENAERFKIERLESAFSSSEKLKFSLDNHEDLKLIERIFEQMQRPHYTYTLEEKAELLRMAREVEPGR